ncbi:Cell cycle checkpoint protein rad17 [Serendipita sp. 399]|nr:Cell cycle checkpoint protein rad17 [Serendipita sp. 399]
MFQDVITQHVETSEVPLVIIISDAGSRGEHRDDEGWQSRQTDAINARTVVPPSLMQSAYATRIEFNPIAPTLMRQGLKWLVDTHYGDVSSIKPTKEVIDLIVESSSGDIRSAIMSLQFTSPAQTELDRRRKKKSSNIVALISRRENTLALFHLLGKVLYNKRAGDPISKSLSKKEQIRERELDESLPEPLPLPPHMVEFQRKSSKVNVEALYADSPVDTSLLSLYLHQNYYQFCEEIEQCDGVIDALSSIDSMAEIWDSRGQVASEKFQIMTRASLLSLPSPVPRQNQKLYKPAFFDSLKQGNRGLDDVLSVQDWLASCGTVWNLNSIKLDLPILLAHAGKIGRIPSLNEVHHAKCCVESLQQVPYHASFSHLPWVRNSLVAAASLDEGEDLAEESLPEPHHKTTSPRIEEPMTTDTKFWLESDDIDEF